MISGADRTEAAEMCRKLSDFGFPFTVDSVKRVLGMWRFASDADAWRMLAEYVVEDDDRMTD